MGVFTAEEYDVLASELQLALDSSVFIGEAYVSEDAPDIVNVLLRGEMISEPGARGIYPFYADKHWLTDKVREFTEKSLDSILEQWGCSDASYTSTVDFYNMRDNGECSLMMTFEFN